MQSTPTTSTPPKPMFCHPALELHFDIDRSDAKDIPREISITVRRPAFVSTTINADLKQGDFLDHTDAALLKVLSDHKIQTLGNEFPKLISENIGNRVRFTQQELTQVEAALNKYYNFPEKLAPLMQAADRDGAYLCALAYQAASVADPNTFKPSEKVNYYVSEIQRLRAEKAAAAAPTTASTAKK